MRVLLDTNIIIYRENKKITNYSVGHLYRWIDTLKYDKVIHPYSIDEIKKYNYSDPLEAITLKLDAYHLMQTIAPIDSNIITILNTSDKTENDRIDTALLNEVYLGRVDILITEDRKMRRKASLLGISNKVFSINSFISFATEQNPALVEYKALSVKKEYFGNIDISNSFFDSFRASYPGFDRWFAKKCDEEAYICYSDKNVILGFLYLKTEEPSENYTDIQPIFMPKKRLKVGTFKVESTGFRLGERFIKIIFDNALQRGVDEIYVTLFENKSELLALADLLYRWGFVNYGTKTTGNQLENVLVKQMKAYDYKLTSKQNFPNLLYQKQKFILPIKSQYHTPLMPDSILRNENEVDFLGNEPHKYALQKVYISWSYERNINPGDLVLFYRMGNDRTNKKYSSTITTLCIVDEVIYKFNSKKEYLEHCQNRSVFTNEELDRFWNNKRQSLMILKFIFVKSLVKKPILAYLWESGIVQPPSGPRSFMRLTDEQFNSIIKYSETDFHRYWRV